MQYNAITVTELNTYVKEKFEQDEYLNNVLVKGEISNFKHHFNPLSISMRYIMKTKCYINNRHA